MALFGRGDKKGGVDGGASKQQEAFPLPSRKAHCRICSADQSFSRCWRRASKVQTCPCCNTPFENPGALYRKTLPACPCCGECLEQPGFEYGLCDGCGSKFEIIPGTRPSLLPNLEQRKEMAKHGKARIPD